MTALQPLAAALGALSIPLVLAYLHRRKRQIKHVPSALLFRVIAGQNTPTRRAVASPRHLVSLVAMLLALVGLVLALVDLQPADAKPRDLVIVLDTSASMGATPKGGTRTRLDDAADRIDEMLAALGPRDRVALITAGQHPVVRIGFTCDHARVAELARDVTAAGSTEAVSTALEIADAMAVAGDAALLLVSDGAAVSIPKLATVPQLVRVGVPGPNIGVNALAAREADALGLTEVYVALSSDIGTEREVELVLRVDNQIVDVLPVTVPSTGRVEKLHRLALPDGAQLSATLQNHGADVLPQDDTATTPRGVGERVSVLLVARSRVSFTAEALRLHPRVDLKVAGPFDAIENIDYDLIILETEYEGGRLPPAPKLLATGVRPELVGLTPGERVASPEILRWSFDHPLFRFVDITEIELPRAQAVILPEGATALVDSELGPIAAQLPFEGRDVVYFGFAPHDSDFVLRVGFVNLMANVVEWAAPTAAAGDEFGATILPASESLLDPPAAVPGVTLGGFDSPTRSVPPLWRWLVWAALGLVVLEGTLPILRRGSQAIASKLRRRVRPSEEGGA